MKKEKIRKYIEKIDEYEFVGNWFDSNLPEDIEESLPELPEGTELYQDSDGDYIVWEEKDGENPITRYELFDLTWYKIWSYVCPGCKKKFIVVQDETTADFYANKIDYCLDCAYPAGVYNIEKLDSIQAIEAAIEEGFEISEKNIQLIEKIYPLSFAREDYQ
jgi:hypothetical protein